MSASDSKKTKRKKQRKGAVAKAATRNASNACEEPSSSVDTEAFKKLEKLMDAPDEMPMIPFSRGLNPFLDRERERCLLCNCERQDPPEAAKIRAESAGNKPTDANPLSQLPLWVCPTCRKTADQETEKKQDSFLDQDLGDPSTFLPDISIKPGSEPTTPNGTLCSCEACTERRMIESNHEQETAELQRCWTDLRKVVRFLYGQRNDTGDQSKSLPDDELVQDLVQRLCSRDPHQLFLRLESQVREFVIDMKVRLLKQLSTGFKTPPLAKQFISMLLDEYTHLCKVARKMGTLLRDLQDHLKRFKVTWDLHNKHLFQSIAYSEPSIRNSLTPLISQLRLGAASKESYNEDTYPNLLHRYLKFDDEMSVVSVVWRDCHQLIEAYNEEQSALKLKQKMLREDWEFFKTQRKILEQQVSKNPKASLSHSLEAQFTETMRLMLQGSKPTQEELVCARCNRKRCPCDECTITHMITCGIINPEVVETADLGTDGPHHANFMHDPNRYRINVSPPSMSSTTSSSGSSSPIMVDHERLTLPFEDELPENAEDIPEEIDDAHSYDEDDDDDDDEDDDDEDDEDDNYDNPKDDKEGEEDVIQIPDLPSLEGVIEINLPSLIDEDLPSVAGKIEANKMDTCNCDHCVSQAKRDQMLKADENQCQCHVCLQQQGKTVLTPLPQHVPQMVPRPGELHLYPHIHGSSGLHGVGRGHVRPLLQPNLYDLHLPIQQRQKPAIQTKVPIKLDFDTPEGIHDHIYHAYGDWDNTYAYDPQMLIRSKFDSDLLPPPPISSAYSSSFLTEPFSVPSHFSPSSVSSINTTSSFTSTSFTNQVSTTLPASSLPTDTAPSPGQDQSTSDTISKAGKCNTSNVIGSPAKSHTPPCTRPATLGGNNMPKFSDKSHSQHCKKHNLQGIAKAGNHNHIMQTKEGRQMVQDIANKIKPNINSHQCNFGNGKSNHMFPGPGAPDSHAGIGSCANSTSLPTTVNNVSVGTSTLCTEPNCDGNHDDNYDSIDDSCSEQSSSTSTSNQKEGKYCDCCYCEFFGHGSPPMAPTSKNYAEMRDKLRLRLKKKNENDPCQVRRHSNHNQSNHMERPMSTADPMEQKGLDELIRFINGGEGRNGEKPLSAKAAKRARQKQRKAEEKERQEMERLKQEEEEKAAAAAEAAARAKQNKKQKKETSVKSTVPLSKASSTESNSENSSTQRQKKKSKHKDKGVSEDTATDRGNSPCDTKQETNPPKTTSSGAPVQKNTDPDVYGSSVDPPRPSPQGSSCPTSQPVQLDNLFLFNNTAKKNKNKVPGKCLQSGDDARQQQTQQQLQQQQRQLVEQQQAKLIRLKIQEETRRQREQQSKQLRDLEQQQQEHAMAEKAKKANGVQPNSGDRNGKKAQTSAQPSPAQSQKVNHELNNNLKQAPASKLVNGTAPKPELEGKRLRKLLEQSYLKLSQAPVEKITPGTSTRNLGKPQDQVRPSPQGQAKNGDVHAPPEKTRQSSPPDQGKNSVGKNKKNKKKNRKSSDINFIDEVFMPKSESDLEGGDLDENEREIEAFKRFCYDSSSAPVRREKLQVNVNIKDIFSKKKSGLSCN